MNDLSARRRLAGRGLMAAALVALPLTASISYAASDAMPAPPAPPAAPAAPNAPVPPAPPVPPAAPDTPLPPLAPAAFQSSADIDVDVDEDVDNWEVREVIVDKDGQRKEVLKRHKVVIRDKDRKMTAEERAELRRELRQELAEADMEIKEAMEEARVALLEVRNGEHGVTKVSMECKNGKGGEFTDEKGHKTVMLCTSEIMANALTGLKEARKAISRDSEMPADMKAEVLQALDEQIASWNKKQG